MTERLSDKMEKEYLTIQKNVDIIKNNIAKSLEKAGRSDNVVLLAATKMNSPERINAAIRSGVKVIGENRVQELLEKYDGIDKENVSIHFIGHLQTNKVKYIIDKVDLIQSLDSISLAGEIDKQAKKHNKVMDVLVEVNICAEESKSGVLPENLENFLKEISSFPNIRVLGLMSIPPIMNDVDTQREIFRKIMKIYVDISQKKLDNINMQILSMGMSDDYEIAVEEGSTMVRVGSSLFGKRNYNK